jgi:hypothetical protein
MSVKNIFLHMKVILSFVLFFGMFTTANAQDYLNRGIEDIQFRIIERIPYASYNNKINSRVDGEMEEGQIVNLFGSAYDIFDRVVIDKMQVIFWLNSTRYYASAKSFLSVDTEDVFLSDLVIDYNRNNDYTELWCPIYYCDVFQSKERDTLTKFEPELLKYNGFDPAYMEDRFWYDYKEVGKTEINEFDINGGRFIFYSSVMRFGNIARFLIKNIKKTENGYAVTCYCESVFPHYPGPAFNWGLIKEEEFINFLLFIDGEYADIYVENTEKDNYFGTIVRVKEEFIKQYQSLIKTNTCDLTRVQWPRRADGSTDYSTPPITSVLEEDKQSELIELSVDTENPQTIQNSAKTSSMPLWARLAIIGGAVVIAGGVVFVVKITNNRSV